MVDDLRINEENIIITTCDADTFFHPNYFAAGRILTCLRALFVSFMCVLFIHTA